MLTHWAPTATSFGFPGASETGGTALEAFTDDVNHETQAETGERAEDANWVKHSSLPGFRFELESLLGFGPK